MLLLTALLAAAPYRQLYPLPNNLVPNGWGVNLGFGEVSKAEITRIRSIGPKWVRRDLFWHEVERVKGRYDFAKFDRAMAAYRAAGVRPVFILCYGNGLYGKDSVDTATEREGFVRYVEAAVRHFRGQGVIWEMWNEPNGVHWPPKPDLLNYTRLAVAVGKAIRRVAKDEWYVGPALAGIDMPFLEGCFRAGLLQYWDAITLHPYRPMEPETVAVDYARVRAMAWRYARRGVPILCGEWGYSAAANGLGETKQADYVLRQYLTNVASNVPLTVWYNWNNNGPNPKDEAHNFGITKRDFTDKPAARAMRWLISNLRGWQFDKRLAGARPNDWILVFRKFRDVRIVAWTTNGTSRMSLPKPVMEMPELDVRQWDTEDMAVAADVPWLRIGERPILVGGSHDAAALLRVPTVPPSLSIARPDDIAAAARPLFRLRQPVTVDFGSSRITAATEAALAAKLREAPAALDRSETPRSVAVGVAGVRQPMLLLARNPLVFELLPPTKEGLPVRIAGATVGGTVDGQPATVSGGLLPYRRGARYRLAAMEGGRSVLSVPEFEVVRLEPTEIAATQLLEGAPGVAGGAVSGTAANPPGLPYLYPDGLQIDYEFGKGWQYALARGPALPLKLPGRPIRYGFWAHGDGSGALLLMRYEDATGQTFQPEGIPVDWTGWRYVSFTLRGETGGRWGGANDGVVHYPIKLTSSLVIDNTAGRGIKGRLHVVAPFVLVGR